MSYHMELQVQTLCLPLWGLQTKAGSEGRTLGDGHNARWTAHPFQELASAPQHHRAGGKRL